MKLLLLFTVLFVGFIAFGQTDSIQAYDKMLDGYYGRTVPLIKPKELYQKIVSGEKNRNLDARKGREYKVSIIKGAVHVYLKKWGVWLSKRKATY